MYLKEHHWFGIIRKYRQTTHRSLLGSLRTAMRRGCYTATAPQYLRRHTAATGVHRSPCSVIVHWRIAAPPTPRYHVKARIQKHGRLQPETMQRRWCCHRRVAVCLRLFRLVRFESCLYSSHWLSGSMARSRICCWMRTERGTENKSDWLPLKGIWWLRLEARAAS